MRIRSFALAYMTGLGALALAGVAVISSQQWAHLADISEARALVRVLQPSIRFVEALALERGVYNQVLVSKDTGLEQSRRLVTERVTATDRIFDDTLDRISSLRPGLREQFSEPIAQARRIINAARSRADRVWQDPGLTSTDAARALVSEYIKAGTLIDQTIAPIQADLARIDPRLALMLEISRLSNEMREAAGQRSTILSRYAGTLRRLEPGTSNKVSELTGQIAITWERLLRIAGQLDNSPRIEAAVARARLRFIEDGEQLYARMAEAARTGASPPVDFLAWRRWTVDMLGNTLAARDAPVEQALELTEDIRRAATHRLWLALSGLGAAVLIVCGAGLLVERRLLTPITRLTQALEHVSDFDPASGAEHNVLSKDVTELTRHYAARNDEIGSLARALDGCQQRTIELAELNQRFDAALANLPQGLCFFNANQELVVCNRRYAEVYGLTPEETRPGTPLAVLERRLANGTIEKPERNLPEALTESASGQAGQRVVELQNGRAILVRRQALPGGGWVATHEDITDRRKSEAQIAHMARHDALTDLANRILFREEMERTLNGLRQGGKLAVLCLDLDRFKPINDTLGHAFGDILLKQVADRLRECVRETDTVARLGGDEFAIVYPGVADPNHATNLAQRIIDRLSAPYDLDGNQAVIGTSVGIAIGPTDSTDPDELLKCADMALYRAKADGRGTYRFFETEMDARMQRRRLLELDLRKALPNDEFEIHYQPILDLRNNEVSGFEALLRWNHPTRGRISPADFIPLAEETGLIGEIGAWVLKQACQDAMAWPVGIKVAVNLSAIQFGSCRLLLDVTTALAGSGLSADRLELEITEAVLLRDTESVLATLHQLRNLGVRISMDDFGTGYSSLSYLRKFPFDKIKIDQSFIRDLGDHSDSVSIVRAVAGMGAELGIATTAEGVETSEQLARSRSEGCTEVQGFLLSPPIPRSEVADLLRALPAKWKSAA